ncbi:MAG: hypothetical protein KAR35_03415 [Candidatus Heimdallarchaeota archaeon]|nr:hypothetical protein [Candidatus Heimdallarchaeota archaeon]MCK5048404.1 hypothetical protein [Candidatus Heimdallarchaeota archaeon]
MESSELPKIKCEFSSCPEWDKCPFDHSFNGKSREKKGRVSSIFVCQNKEKPHKYACNIFQDLTLFPAIEGSMRTGIIIMGDSHLDITYCPQCENEGINLIPIQDFLHPDLKSLLTQIKIKSPKLEEKREEELNDESFREEIYGSLNDIDINDEDQISDSLSQNDKVEFDTLTSSSNDNSDSSLILIPDADQAFQTKRESFLDEKRPIAYNFDLWIKIIDAEREKENTKLALNQITHRMIRLLAKVTHYTENAFVPLPEVIEPKNKAFTAASIDETLFWQKIFIEIKKIQPKFPYLSFNNLLVNNFNLNTLILDFDVYCSRNLIAV